MTEVFLFVADTYIYGYNFFVVPKRLDLSFCRSTTTFSISATPDTTFQPTHHHFPLRPKVHCVLGKQLYRKPDRYIVDVVASVLSAKPAPTPNSALLAEVVTGTQESSWVWFLCCCQLLCQRVLLMLGHPSMLLCMPVLSRWCCYR